MLLVFSTVIIGVGVGIFVGRAGERARRSIKDRGVAKTGLDKAHKAMLAETKKAGVAIFLVFAFLVAIFVGALNYPR